MVLVIGCLFEVVQFKAGGNLCISLAAVRNKLNLENGASTSIYEIGRRTCTLHRTPVLPGRSR